MKLDYPTYTKDAYSANFNGDTIAVVNIHNDFYPDEFTLNFEVDSTQIGESFRPDSADVLITYNGNGGAGIPSQWPVISMMQKDGIHEAIHTVLVDGIGKGNSVVWVSFPDGITYYQYGIRIESLTTDGIETDDAENPYYTILYQDPAYFKDGTQSQMLVATLVPKVYNVNYILGGGTMVGEYPTTHTWSYSTDLSVVPDPTRAGFVFDGWYLDKDFLTPAGDTIDASVASDVTLYAKWLQVMDIVDLTVIVDHTQEGVEGCLASNYNKTLYTQLMSAPRTDVQHNDYTVMDGYVRNYPDGRWHTRGDMVQTDTFQVPRYFTNLSAEYDYSVYVELDGYYVSERTVTKVAQPDGSTLHQVVVTLKYRPDQFKMEFYVKMAEKIPVELYPKTADVKITCWYDHPTEGYDWHWNIISQHESISVPVTIDPMSGIGHYEVWQWYNADENIPYHYRIEVVKLHFADGTSIEMNETVASQTYVGGAYHADIVVENGAVPVIPTDGNEYDTSLDKPFTELTGIYGEIDTENSTEEKTVYKQHGTVGAVIDLNRITFHANNKDYQGNDIFREYFYNGVHSSGEGAFYVLNSESKIESFYDIPEFSYHVHNEYIFKGWYLDQENDNDSRPIDWNTVYEDTGDVDIYAHWIHVEDVATEPEDGKSHSENYNGFDNLGAEIRVPETDDVEHYGDAASGLRFYAVLSDSVYDQINALKGLGEYGFVVAKRATTDKYADGVDETVYSLQYKDSNVNGVDTTTSYKYVQNMYCSGVPDHYEGTNYRLFSAVITFTGLSGDTLTAMQSTEFVARAYIRYTDANGLTRTYYNNYDENVYSGCSASYSGISGGATQNTVEEYESVQNVTLN